MTTPVKPHPLLDAAADALTGPESHPVYAYGGRDKGWNTRREVIALLDRTCRVSEREADHARALAEAKRRCPDYPWSQNTMSEVVWALGESLLGVQAACDGWRKRDAERERLLAECRDTIRELRASLIATHEWTDEIDRRVSALLARLDARETPTV